MQVKVKLNHLKIAPRKVRLVADLVRGKKASLAKALLNFSVKRGAVSLRKLLNSALAAAKNNYHLDEDRFYITEVKVDEGPKLKRFRARSRGQSYSILKRSSCVTLVISEINKSSSRVPKQKESAKKSTSPKKEQILAKKDEKLVNKKKEEKINNKVETLKPKFSSETVHHQGLGKKSLKRVFRRKAF